MQTMPKQLRILL